jgi:hypothetical protein
VILPSRVHTRTIPVGTDGPEGGASLTTVSEPGHYPLGGDVVAGAVGRGRDPGANRRCLEMDTWSMLIVCRSTWTATSSSASQPRKLHSRTSGTSRSRADTVSDSSPIGSTRSARPRSAGESTQC